MDKIICIKIAQKVIRYPKHEKQKNPYEYFPFDRVYLVEKQNTDLVKRLFRYYFLIPLDRELFHALTTIQVQETSTSTIARRNKKETETISLVDNIANFLDWNIVIPTTYTLKHKAADGALVMKLQYILTRATRRATRSSKIKMPPIMLHTPVRESLLCSSCSELPSFYAGDCTPGQRSCYVNADICTTITPNIEKKGE